MKGFLSTVSLAFTALAFDLQAALIDTDNSSYIDTSTSLEWMDFGVNNVHPIGYLIENVNTLYPGWRLASEAEVIELWTGYFEPLGEQNPYDFDYAPPVDTGGLFRYSALDEGGGSVFQPYLDVMGFDSLSGDGVTKQAVGYFLTADGGLLGHVSFGDRIVGPDDPSRFDEINGFVDNRGLSLQRLEGPNLEMSSTLLVRDVSQVPIPAAAWLFGSALVVLGWIKRRKANSYFNSSAFAHNRMPSYLE